MSHQVVWTKRVETFFADAANLTDTERAVLRCRVCGMTRTATALYLSMSVSTVDRIVARLKRVYDVVQKEYPEELRPRKTCAEEAYMDAN